MFQIGFVAIAIIFLVGTVPSTSAGSPIKFNSQPVKDSSRVAKPLPTPVSKLKEPLMFYASQSGKPTLDQGEGGGNPFASALIELLERPSLTYSALQSDLVSMTKKKSGGFQEPDVPDIRLSVPLQIKSGTSSGKRVAFVFVFSDYRSERLQPLPGADKDLHRVALALKNSGFEVQTAVNPSRTDLQVALQSFSTNSADAEVSIIYATGHGFEYNGQVYLVPIDYPFSQDPKALSEFAIHIPSLKNFVHAKDANFVFYGGCRTIMR
ncbi:caspase family protein [Geomonas paludis]|uniref:Caspase family protein n=1 Tax=Geomonas paludis TaxID=2740185 RepID=A0ABY4LGQ6_9BACT|nr:caspase family protein [Geomonas paludis]UPU37176.1 caspase family protein [Geomonas paludis]